MSASEHEFSESSSMESQQSRDSPYSSPSQQVPHLANAFSGITCGDDVIFHVDVKMPYLRIVEHPQDHFRFRYKSEMVGTHGCLLGKSSALNRTKSHPTVELVNYTGKALIRARLAQVDKDEEHPHQLLEDEEDREVSAVVPQQGSYKVGFAGMGIIHKPKKHITALIMKNYMSKIDGSKSMTAKELRVHCENLAKEINLNIVRLKFSAHDINTDKEICPPVFSEPIHNEKSAATNDLKICRISRYFGRPRGGDDVFILVEKVNKKNIVIRFYELDEHGDEVWSANGNFLQSDVHHQYAIVFRTPPYRDPQITKDVKVNIQLVRPSDGRTSERKEFVYKAELAFKDNKRRRVNSSFSSLESSSGGSVKNEVPTTVEMLDRSDRVDAVSNIPVFQINIPQIPVTAACPAGELADALLYSAGGAGGAGVTGGLSPMLGAPNVPEPPVISIDSGEFERLIQHDPDLPSDDRRKLCEMDWAEYMQSFGDSLTDKTLGSMDFLRRSMELVTDSGKGSAVIKSEPVSPSKSSPEEPKNVADQTRKNEQYNAFYTAEDGKEVKKLVREICEIMKNKTGYKKQVVKSKLENLFDMRLSNGDTFLHMALASNQPSLQYVVQLVHAMRMPHLLNLRNDRRQTALHLALIYDLPALLPTLISKGCDPAAADAEGNNAVHYAVVCGTCLKPLLEAIKRFDVPCDLNACNNEKQTPLHLAAVYDSAASVKLLVQHGCNAQARDAAGRTPLHLAVTDDCHCAARALILLTPKSDIDALDGAGNTALQIVCEKENICNEKQGIIKLLLDKKADPWARQGSAQCAGLRASREPALRALFPSPTDDDVKSKPDDDYESADEGNADGTLSGLSLWLGAVSERLDARGSWRELATRLHADALLSWYSNTASPARTLLTHIKESGDNVTSKSLAMHLQDMGEIDSANIIRQYIE